jgi:hypothetical protein
MCPKRSLALSVITTIIVSLFGPATHAAPSRRSVCYSYVDTACKTQGKFDIIMTLVGNAVVPTDLARAASPVCQTERPIKKMEDKEGGKRDDRNNYYHYFKFECERG